MVRRTKAENPSEGDPTEMLCYLVEIDHEKTKAGTRGSERDPMVAARAT